MKDMNKRFKQLGSEYAKRITVCVLGLLFFSVGNLLGVKAGSAGTNAWNTLALGMSDTTGISFGTATLVISGIIILLDLLGKGKLGIGTLLNATLVAFASDVYLKIFHFMPEAPNAFVGSIYTLLGQTIISFAMIIYMKAELGCGPRDTLMVIIGQKLPKAPIGLVKFLIEIGVLAVGFLLGAPVGIGTVLVMALQASIFQLACRICRYEPRSVVHEDFIDTWKRITSK